jgi:hypothetical protein
MQDFFHELVEQVVIYGLLTKQKLVIQVKTSRLTLGKQGTELHKRDPYWGQATIKSLQKHARGSNCTSFIPLSKNKDCNQNNHFICSWNLIL